MKSLMELFHADGFDVINTPLSGSIGGVSDLIHYTRLILEKLCSWKNRYFQDQILHQRMEELQSSNAFSLLPAKEGGMDTAQDYYVRNVVKSIWHYSQENQEPVPQSKEELTKGLAAVFFYLEHCLEILEKYPNKLLMIEPFDGLSLKWANLLSHEYHRVETRVWDRYLQQFSREQVTWEYGSGGDEADALDENNHISNCSFLKEIVGYANTGSTRFVLKEFDDCTLTAEGFLIDNEVEVNHSDQRQPELFVSCHEFHANLEAWFRTRKVSVDDLHLYWEQQHIVEPSLDHLKLVQFFEQIQIINTKSIRSGQSPQIKSRDVETFVFNTLFICNVIRRLESSPTLHFSPEQSPESPSQTSTNVALNEYPDKATKDVSLIHENCATNVLTMPPVVAKREQPKNVLVMPKVKVGWLLAGALALAVTGLAIQNLSVATTKPTNGYTQPVQAVLPEDNTNTRLVSSVWNIPAEQITRVPQRCQRSATKPSSSVQFASSKARSSRLGVYLADLKYAEFNPELLRTQYKVLIGSFCPTGDAEPFVEAAVRNKKLLDLPRAISLSDRKFVQVLVGPFDTEAKANQVLKSLKVYEDYKTALVLKPILEKN
jgi:hypothetical protein